MGRSYRASKEKLEKAKKAFQLKGWTQDYLAGTVNCTRQTVNKFFARRPVEKHLFIAICNELSLEWGDVADLESQKEHDCILSVEVAQGNISESTQESSNTTQVLTSVPVEESADRNAKAIFVLSGTINSVDKAKLKAIEAHLRKISGDANLTITDVESGSIKITLEGSSEGLEELKKLFESGELNEVLGIPVEDVQLLTGGTTEKDKIRLVQEIVAQGAKGRDLSDVDLSGADLRGADLSNADLNCADLRGTNLSDANLEGADLNCADLRGANLSDANLSLAYLHDAVIDKATIISNKWRLAWEIVNQESESRNLRGADLNSANLSFANLSGADLNGADLSDANLSFANLSGADLSFANLSGADLSGANLSGADLSGAIVKNARFVNNQVIYKRSFYKTVQVYWRILKDILIESMYPALLIYVLYRYKLEVSSDKVREITIDIIIITLLSLLLQIINKFIEINSDKNFPIIFTEVNELNLLAIAFSFKRLVENYPEAEPKIIKIEKFKNLYVIKVSAAKNANINYLYENFHKYYKEAKYLPLENIKSLVIGDVLATNLLKMIIAFVQFKSINQED